MDDSGHVKMNGAARRPSRSGIPSRVLYSRARACRSRTRSTPDVYEQVPAQQLHRRSGAGQAEERCTSRPRGRPTTRLSSAAPTSTPPGILPTAEEVENFLADKSPDKRAKLIDALLERDEFVDYWAYKWSDLLLVSSSKLRPNADVGLLQLDSRQRESRTSRGTSSRARSSPTSGNTRQNGALNYFVLHKDPIELAENATQAFLGQRLTCARCHNHPLEKWTQKQYYQMANLFSRVGLKNGDRAGDIDRVRQGDGRHQSSAAAAAAAADAARRQADGARFAGRPPRRISPSG